MIVGGLFLLYMVVQLISFGIQGKSTVGVFEKTVLFIASPLQNFAKSGSGAFRELYRYYIALTEVSRQNDALSRENRELRSKLDGLGEIDEENRRLRGLLSMADARSLTLAGAERVSTGVSPYQVSMRFRFDEKVPVQRGMALIHPAGVVGQVLDVHRATFDALLLTDKVSAIDVLCKRSRQRGILIGHNPSTLRFEFLEKSADVQLGDEVLTTGLDGVYPKDIPVGRVVEVSREGTQLFMDAFVKPFVDFHNLEEASVVVSKP